MSIAYDPAPSPDGAEPSFPPLFTGVRTPVGVDPLAKAAAAAGAPDGVAAGTLFWSDRDDALDAALALAPENALGDAMAMVFAVANGLGDAIGALTPPEVALTWEWPDIVKVNGARCGTVRAEAAGRDPEATSPWLVVGVTIQIAARSDAEPGRDPSVTALIEEGCADLTRQRLLESWSRHSLVWINRWLDDGFRPLHDAWVARVERRGETVDLAYAGARREGLFLGLDERGGMLMKTPDGVETLDLVHMLDHPRRWPDGIA